MYRKMLPTSMDVLNYKLPSKIPKPCSSLHRESVYIHEKTFCKKWAGKK